MPGTPSITTEDEFRERLDALIENARRENVTVTGSWSCRRTAGPTDYEVLITEVVRRSG